MKKIICAICLLIAAATSHPASAQDGIGLKDLAPVIIDISDIDKLRLLNPLEMKADQIEKVLTLYKKTRDEYLQKVTDTAGPALKKFAEDAKALRKRLLAGGTVPDSFVKSVTKSQTEFVEKRRSLDAAALKKMTDGMKDILDNSQINTIIKITRTLLKRDSEPVTKSGDDQIFSTFVRGTFFEYDRIAILLEDMLKAHKAPPS